MVKILFQKEKFFKKKFKDLLCKREDSDQSIDKVVNKIINNVKKKSDVALISYTKKFDRFNVLNVNDLIVSKKEIDNGLAQVEKKTINSLKRAIERVRSYHKRQIPKNDLYRDNHNVLLGGIWNPIDSVGLYVPGGAASYPSSLIMNAIPAIVAGVERIVITVPAMNGRINPLVLACAKILGIKEIFKIGGAQAIAALAYGTKTIKSVDKIVGPGNAYVASAKKKVFGKVGIDMIAGPSEILVLADRKNNPDHIAIDLLSQAEHDELAQSILITDNEKFAKDTILSVDKFLKVLDRKKIARKSWDNYGAVIVTKDLKNVSELINEIAPEHLELAIDNADKMLKKIKNAGAVFLGRNTPEAIGDYIAGPNHVLPTSGSARFSSGLSVNDFLKRQSLIKITKTGIERLGSSVINLAKHENLDGHANSVKMRLKKEN